MANYDFQKSYDVSLDSLSVIRDDLHDLCNAKLWDEDIEHLLALATTEIVTNVIKYPDEKASDLKILLYENSKKLILEIQDNGSSFSDFSKNMQPIDLLKPENNLQDSGRGLNMLFMMFDNFEYEEKKENFYNRYILETLLVKKEENKPTIILIDDNDLDLDIYSEYLKNDYNVLAYHRAHEALKYIQENKIDLILCDINMPDMDGFSFYQSVNVSQKTSSIPFIFLSSKRDQKTEDRIKKFPISDFITKPVVKDDLVSTVDRILKRHKHEMTVSGERLDRKITDLIAPSIPSTIGDYRTYFDWQSVDAGGGDILFTFPAENKNDKTIIFFGDMMGHGEQAKFFGMSVLGFIRGYVRSLITQNQNPADILSALSDAMFNDHLFQQTMMTAQVIAVSNDMTIEIANAGHIEPVLNDKEGNLSKVGTSGSLLGLSLHQMYKTETIEPHNAERLVFMTDGFLEIGQSETMDVVDFLGQFKDKKSDHLVSSMMDKSKADLTDDALVLVIERN